MASALLCLFHQPPGASCGSLRRPRLSAPSVGSFRLVRGQHHSIVLPAEARGHTFLDSQLRSAGSSEAVLVQPYSAASPVHSGEAECVSRLPQSSVSSSGVGMDPLFSGVSGASSSLAGYHRPFRDGSEPSAASVFFADGRSAVGRHGCHDAVVGRHAGLRLSPIQSSASCAGEGSAVQGLGADSCGSILAAAPLVSGSSGASGGCSGVPSTAEGSAQTASLPSFPPEPPCASSDCVSYLQRSARSFGFSSAVACQLSRCRRALTRVNYQAKWSVNRAWCRCRGHSVLCPSVPKIGSFLLYLRRSLALSYFSIASHRSMLSGVFRFVLSELSSHFILRDLLHSFRLERPLPSSVSLLGIFYVSFLFSGVLLSNLYVFARFGILPARSSFSFLSRRLVGFGSSRPFVSAHVSSSGDDLYLSYLPEFRAKTESSVRPLPRSFSVHSLKVFVADLPDELLAFIFCVRLLFLLVLVLSLSPLVLLLAPFRRMPSAFSSGMLLCLLILQRVCLLLLVPCLLLFLPPLTLALLFALMGFLRWLLHGLFTVMLLWRLSLRLLLGLLTPSLLFIYQMFSSPLLMVQFGSVGGCWFCGLAMYFGF